MISPREFPPQPREAGFVLYEDSFLKRQAQCHLPIFNAGCRAAARGSTHGLSTGFMRRCLDEVDVGFASDRDRLPAEALQPAIPALRRHPAVLGPHAVHAL